MATLKLIEIYVKITVILINWSKYRAFMHHVLLNYKRLEPMIVTFTFNKIIHIFMFLLGIALL